MSSSVKTGKTGFSSYKSPRPAPSVPTTSPSYSQTTQLRKTASESSIIRRGLWRNNNNELAYDYYSFEYASRAVRQGHVGVQRDKLRGWSWTWSHWLVLDDTALRFFCPKRKLKSEPRESLQLHQIRQIERFNTKPYCLVLAAASKTWYLLFKDSASLYDWYYDLRVRCPLMRIGHPTDFCHRMHVTYDHAAREITGLPEDWIRKLSSGSVPSEFRYDQRPPQSSAVISAKNKPLPMRPKHRASSDNVSQSPAQDRRLTSRNRSASDATPASRAASVAPSELFRRSPLRYREVEARDLTGAVHRVHLLPATQHDNCDTWKAEWKGSFGTRKVAIQVIRLPNTVSDTNKAKLKSLVLREVKVLHQLRHQNVVRTRGFCKDQGLIPALVSTWISNGNILDYVRDKEPAVKKALKMKLLTEVAAGLNYLHTFSRMIVHGDLHGANIMITNNGSACITGYGLNPILQELGGDSRTHSPRWAAIEVIRIGRRQISYWSDVFSFARTVLEVMTEQVPYHYLSDDTEVSSAVVRGVPPRRPPIFGDDGLWHFLERCWKEEPTQRPSMSLALLRMEDILGMYNPPIEEGHEPPGSAPP